MRILTHPVDLKKKLESIDTWKMKDQPATIKQFFADYQLGKITGQQVAEITIQRYIESAKYPLEFLLKQKMLATLGPKDTERFVKALMNDKLKSATGKPYAESSKVKIRDLVCKLLTWKGLGPDVTNILKVKVKLKKKTPNYLTEQEIKKMYQQATTPEQRFMIIGLASSGARAGEFHNLRKEDIEMPEGDSNFVKITLKEEFSKTQVRTISLYWMSDLVIEAFRDYLGPNIKGPLTEEAVMRTEYKNMRKWLDRVSRKAIDKHVNYHLFRSSAATYYGGKMNRQELCYFFGWRFSSPMPDLYINRSGMRIKQLDKQFTDTELQDLKNEVAKWKHDAMKKGERLEVVEEQDKLIVKIMENNEQIMSNMGLQLNKMGNELKVLKKRL